MEQTPEDNVIPIQERPRLRNIRVPHSLIKCFVCGKPLVNEKGDLHEDFKAAAIDGVLFMACQLHVDDAQLMTDQTARYLEILKQQETKTE